MIINRDTINDYLAGKNCSDWSNQWIFHSIVENEYLIENVSEDKKNLINEAANLLENELKNFQPYNRDIWDAIFNEWNKVISESTVYLVVGSPDPYDAMVRTSPCGKEVIIYDINRMLDYVDSVEQLIPIIKSLLTHEYSHACLHSDYPTPDGKSSFISKLQYICFDEGFAHFLSFHENVKKIDWLDNEKLQKKGDAYNILRQAVSSSIDEHSELLMKSNSGAYWDKFGAISGMFAIAGTFAQSDYSYDNVIKIYEDGYKNFLKEIFDK